MLIAHVKWFANPQDISVSPLSFLEILFLLIILAGGIWIMHHVHNWFNSKFDNRVDAKLRGFSEYLTPVVRIVTGLSLILNSAYGYLLAPNILPDSDVANLLSRLLVIVGVFLIAGIYTRLAGLLLLLTYLTTLFMFDITDIIDHLEFVGLSSYLIISGSGRVSIDSFRGKKPETINNQKRAASMLIIWSGFAIIAIALSEKLFNLDLAQDFLNTHSWNVLSFVGVSDRIFIIFTGLIELLIGLSLVLGWATRISTAVLLGTMTVTALLLGVEEVIGHLFAIALVLVVWVKPKQKQTKNINRHNN